MSLAIDFPQHGVVPNPLLIVFCFFDPYEKTIEWFVSERRFCHHQAGKGTVVYLLLKNLALYQTLSRSRIM